MPPDPRRPNDAQPAAGQPQPNDMAGLDPHEAERRQAMVDLVRAGRGGGILSLPGQLSEPDRQEILAKGEAAEAWQKIYGTGGPGSHRRRDSLGLGRVAWFLAALLGFGLICAALLLLTR